MAKEAKFQNCSCYNSQDIACSSRKLKFFVWQAPYLLLLAGVAMLWFYSGWSGWLWFAGFSWLGVACISNAFRCKRKHCFFTGPIYIILGILSAIINLNLLSINWGYIWFTFLAGTLLSYIPEWGGQKYFRNNSQ